MRSAAQAWCLVSRKLKQQPRSRSHAPSKLFTSNSHMGGRRAPAYSCGTTIPSRQETSPASLLASSISNSPSPFSTFTTTGKTAIARAINQPYTAVLHSLLLKVEGPTYILRRKAISRLSLLGLLGCCGSLGIKSLRSSGTKTSCAQKGTPCESVDRQTCVQLSSDQVSSKFSFQSKPGCRSGNCYYRSFFMAAEDTVPLSSLWMLRQRLPCRGRLDSGRYQRVGLFQLVRHASEAQNTLPLYHCLALTSTYCLNCSEL